VCRTLWNLVTPKWQGMQASRRSVRRSRKSSQYRTDNNGWLIITRYNNPLLPFSQWPGPGKPIDAYTPFRYHLLLCHYYSSTHSRNARANPPVRFKENRENVSLPRKRFDGLVRWDFVFMRKSPGLWYCFAPCPTSKM